MAAQACPGAASALEKAARACFETASALKIAILACSDATSALKKSVQARFSAASTLKDAVRGCCLRSLFESAGLGSLCSEPLHSALLYSVHGYARLHTSILL